MPRFETRTETIPSPARSGGDAAAAGWAAAEPVPFAQCLISPEARAAADRVLASGWVTTGNEVLAFEREFAAEVEAEHAVAVSSCTAGIELALRSLRLPPGAPVLTSTNTFCGAIHAILHAGLQPVLVDVSPQTGMTTPSTVADAVAWLRRQGDRPAAMVVVHYAGDPADVTALALAAGLPLDRVVEDAAHAVGTRSATKPVGSLTAASCFSFYATKNLPIGEGGMVTTNDADLAQAWRRSRLHGMSADAWRRYQPGGSWRYDVHEPGIKANMSDVQGSIGRAQLRHLGDWQARRGEIARQYDEGLTDLVGLAPPHRPLPHEGTHAWHLYVVRVTDEAGVTRDQVAQVLGEHSVGVSVHFIPAHQFSAAARGAYGTPRPMPGADALADQALSLPMHPSLTDAHVRRVLEVLAAALPSSGSSAHPTAATSTSITRAASAASIATAAGAAAIATAIRTIP